MDMLIDQDDQQRDLYLYGSCHLLAVALHRLTGRPIVAALAYDEDIDKEALIHCWVELDGEELLDAGGITSAKSSLQNYPDGDQAAVMAISESGLLALGEGSKLDEMAPCAKRDFEQRLEAAGKYAKQLIERVVNELIENQEPAQYIDQISGLLAVTNENRAKPPRMKP